MTAEATTGTKSGSILRSSAIMAAGTLVSRLLGLLRTVMLVALLGAETATGNAWNTANTLPNMIYILLAGGVLNAVLVPQFTRALKHGDGGQGYTDRLLTLALSILLAITVLMTVAAPLVYFVMDVSGQTATGLGIALAFICLPQIFFYGMYTLLGEALNARGRFGAFMWSPALANVVSIAGLAWLLTTTTRSQTVQESGWTTQMIWVLGGTATLGIVAQAVVLIPPLRRAGYSFRPNFQFRGVGLRTASTIAGWAFGAVVVQQLGQLLVTNVLNSVGNEGAGSNAMAQAFLLFMLPHSLVTLSLVTALYTRLSHAAADGRVDDVRSDLDLGLRLSGLASIAVSIGCFALIMPLSRAMFGPADGNAIGPVTIAMMVGLVPFTLCVLEQRVFYAYEDAKTPFFMQLTATSVQAVLVLLCIGLPKQWVAVGVALAGVASWTTQAVMGWILLGRLIGKIPVRAAAGRYLRLAGAALAGTVVAGLLRIPLDMLGDGRAAGFLTVAVAGTAFLAVYVVVARALGVAEINQLLRPILSRIPGGSRFLGPVEPLGDTAAQPTSGSAAEAPASATSRSGGAESTTVVPVAQASDEAARTAPDSDRFDRFDRFEDDDHTMVVPSPTDSAAYAAFSAPTPPVHVRLPRVNKPKGSTSPAPGAPNLTMGRAAGTPTQPPLQEGRSVKGIEAGHELAGRYELRRLVAADDHKDTWAAHDQTLTRDVVIAVFPTSDDNAAAALDSARRAAAVGDRHLPRILDVGAEDEISYVVSEQIADGESLASMLQFEPLPAEESRRIVGEAAQALAAASSRGLHHLALTPHEIVRAKDGSVYVLGLATHAALSGNDDLPAAEANRTDSVALTACLYAALTGRWAGDGEVRGLADAERSGGDLARVRAARPTAPNDLDALCHQVLSEDEGPRTPSELAGALAPWPAEQVLADPKSDDADATMAGGIPDGDPDATHTIAGPELAEARRRAAERSARRDEDDDYDPSFSDLEPPLPMFRHGTDDPDRNTSKLALIIVALFLVAAVVLAFIGMRGLFSGIGSSSSEPSRSVPAAADDPAAEPSQTQKPSGEKVKVASITSFDPQGTGDEHSDQAGNAIDGNPSTEWRSKIYGRADYMGGRKKGAGLLLDLGSPQQVGTVRINSTGNPSTIEVYVTDQKNTVEGLKPFGTYNQQTGEIDVTADSPATGRYVILWVTRLSAGNIGGYRQKIAEVEVLS